MWEAAYTEGIGLGAGEDAELFLAYMSRLALTTRHINAAGVAGEIHSGTAGKAICAQPIVSFTSLPESVNLGLYPLTCKGPPNLALR